jgi:uncharacterized membrane protein
MTQFFAPFFRVGMVIWLLFSFALSFMIVYQVMLANGVNPLNTASGLPAMIGFFVISIGIALIAVLVGFLMFRWVFHQIED